MPSSDSSDEDALYYRTTTGILPGSCSTQFLVLLRLGLRPGKLPIVNRDIKGAVDRPRDEYFGLNPKGIDKTFERLFRIPRRLFERIYGIVLGKSIFVQKTDEVGKPGIYLLIRVVAAIRIRFDVLDEYLQMSEESVLAYLKSFCKGIVQKLSSEYLREPTEDYLRRIAGINVARSFPGCIGSIDCQHWE